MGTAPRVAGLVLGALCALCAPSAGQPRRIPVEVSPYLLRLSPRAVVDFGAGVIEAEGISTLSEALPAIEAARQAREDALGQLRSALPLVPVDGRAHVGDADARSLAAVLDAATRSPVVAEWRDAEGRVHAIARMGLFGGSDALLPILLDVASQPSVRATRVPLPALIIELRGAESVHYALLPRLVLPGSMESTLTDPWRPLARGVSPYEYAANLEDALRMLEPGQPSVVLYGRPDPANGADVQLDADTTARLAAAHLPPSFEAVDRVILAVGPTE